MSKNNLLIESADTVYLNDPDGRKVSCLTNVKVDQPERLLESVSSFMCLHFMRTDKSKLFFAQNISTHLAQLLGIIKSERKDISKIYVSSHEIKWIKNMLETDGYQPSATHSNYHENTIINSPTFNVEVFPFEDVEKTINKVTEPIIFFISHVSRLTGEVSDIASIYKSIKSKNSILIVDGSQSVGAIGPVEIKDVGDVYLGVSSKFIGAEPHLGFAFISDNFFDKYIKDTNNYPAFDAVVHAKDIYSLSENLKNPLYSSDYSTHIINLKKYALEKMESLDKNILFLSKNQAQNFLTLNFGSIEKNKSFVEFSKNLGVTVSDNTEWSIAEPTVPLVRIGLSVRVTKKDIDSLIEIVSKYIKK